MRPRTKTKKHANKLLPLFKRHSQKGQKGQGRQEGGHLTKSPQDVHSHTQFIELSVLVLGAGKYTGEKPGTGKFRPSSRSTFTLTFDINIMPHSEASWGLSVLSVLV